MASVRHQLGTVHPGLSNVSDTNTWLIIHNENMSQRSLRSLETTLRQIDPDLSTRRNQRATARSSHFVRDEILEDTTPNMDRIENINIPDQIGPGNSAAPQTDGQESENNDSGPDDFDSQEEEATNTMADLLLQARTRVPRDGQLHPLVEEIEEINSLIEKTIVTATAKINKLKKLRNNLESPSKATSLENSARNLVAALTTSIQTTLPAKEEKLMNDLRTVDSQQVFGTDKKETRNAIVNLIMSGSNLLEGIANEACHMQKI